VKPIRNGREAGGSSARDGPEIEANNAKERMKRTVASGFDDG
jgi:hypothetical protein